MLIHPTRPTQIAALASLAAVAGTAAFVTAVYPGLPDLLPVHFGPRGVDGWQFKTPMRVLLPVLVQAALAVSLGAVATLLLWRRTAPESGHEADVRAATTAAEAVVLIATVWIVFQTCTAVALAEVWRTNRPTLGTSYLAFEIGGIIASGVVAVRAFARLGRPAPLPFVPEHWRLGQLYCNPEHPALFVPTRDGRRWTLNFGRPAAAILLGFLLVVGVAVPTIILALALRA